MKINPEKCNVMHVGNNIQTTYEMKENNMSMRLQEITKENYLGVHAASDKET